MSRNIKTILYESETLLPKELAEKFDLAHERIRENRNELDKIHCIMSNLKGDVIRWLAGNIVK